MESKFIEKIEAILKPEYINTVFTWKQVKDALESLSKTTPIQAESVSDEEIEKELDRVFHNETHPKRPSFKKGMLLMRQMVMDRLSQPTEGEEKNCCKEMKRHPIYPGECYYCGDNLPAPPNKKEKEKKIDLEIILREAFVAGYEFSILKKDGGKGIDFDAWNKEKEEK